MTITYRRFHGRPLGLYFMLSVLFLPCHDAHAVTDYLDNGTIKIGIDLVHGGGINYLSESGSSYNVVNVADYGRYIQQSYYSGPQPYIPDGATQNPTWSNWAWNPVQAGDSYGYTSQVLDNSNDGTTLYVKSIPKQWALRNVDAESTMETWITLEANRAQVRHRLTNDRVDTTQYWAPHQELPAVYTIGQLGNLYTYEGNAPFTGGALTKIDNILGNGGWGYWNSSENWAAHVNSSGWGLGVFTPGANLTAGGFAGTPGIGGPTHSYTGYMSPLIPEIIDHNIVYDYEYTLILGDLEDDIRGYVYANQPDLLPHHVVNNNRAHLRYANASDDGLGHGNFLRVNVDRLDPQILGPLAMWEAAAMPTVYIRAAYNTEAAIAQLFFMPEADGFFSEPASERFRVIPDGKVRTYAIDLSSNSAYTGAMTGWRFDPIGRGDTNGIVENIDLYYVSHTPQPGATMPGDIDDDGDVDGRDFLAWQQGHGFPNGAALSDGDADGDGNVDSDDLELWQANSGTITIRIEPLGLAVPEPAGWVLVMVGWIMVPSLRFQSGRN